jgi:hypothetical protein
MKNKNVVLRKLLSAALLGAMCGAPLAGSLTSAQAAPPPWSNGHHRDGDRHENYRTFVGVVTKVESSSKFDMRFDGKTYNVYVSERLPRRLDRNDRVSVYGYRYGNNDIRDARVTILHNR